MIGIGVWWRVFRALLRERAGMLTAVLVPPVAALCFGVSQVDAMVDWGSVAREAQALPVTVAVPAWLSLFVLHAALVRTIARAALWAPGWGWVRRLPVPRWKLGALLLAVWGPLALPLAALSVIPYGWSAAPALWAALAVGGGAAALLGAPAALAALVLGAATLAAAHAAPPCTAPLAVVAWRVALEAAGRAAFPTPVASTSAWPIRPGTPWTALLWRDALTLARKAPGIGADAAGGATLFSVAFTFVGRNAGLEPEGATRAGLVGLAVLALGAVSVPSALLVHLGRAYDPRRWPLSPAARVLATALLSASVVAPGLAAAAVGPTLSAWGPARWSGLVIGAGVAAAWFGVGPRPPRYGTFGGFVVVLVLAAWPGDAWGTLGSYALAAVVLLLAVRAQRAVRAATQRSYP